MFLNDRDDQKFYCIYYAISRTVNNEVRSQTSKHNDIVRSKYQFEKKILIFSQGIWNQLCKD